jgi:hypothetical protein
MSNSNPYTSRKINNLAPTDGITDPQVRAFCDSLANVWQLRNGNTGFDDSERFITKQEWDFIAKNPNIRAIAGIGQPGASTNEPGPGEGGGAPMPPWVQNLVDFLASGITLIDFATVRKTSNELWASIYALTSDMRGQITIVAGDIKALENDITEINTIEATSTSRSATHLFAVKEAVEDPVTGLEAATSAIIEIDKVSTTSKSANAQKTAALVATVNDPATGIIATSAAIIEINKVSADSKSANATHLFGLSTEVRDPATGLPKAKADIAALNKVEVTSSSANARTIAGMLVEFANPTSTNFAAINAINNVDANSSSANARMLSGAVATVGLKSKIFVQSSPPPNPVGNPPYTLKVDDMWLDTAHDNKIMAWNGSAWQDRSDARLGTAAGGITNEATLRVSSDNVLASSINTVWGYLSDDQALVQGGSEIKIVPGAGIAHTWNAVQTETVGADGKQHLVSAVRTDLTAETNKNEGRATSSYSLQVDARVGNVKAIGGMSLTANITPGRPPESACVFVVDRFAIVDPALPQIQFAPFTIANGIVRMNIAYIQNRIQSDTFIPPNINQPLGVGWKIESNGSAQLYGTTTLGRVLTGSTYIDKNSSYPIYATAQGCYQGPVLDGRGVIWTDSKLRFYGPDWHGSAPIGQRLRATDNYVPLSATFIFTGAVDDPLSIWYRYNGGTWTRLAQTTAYGSGYNPCSLAAAQLLGVALGDYIDFGFATMNDQYPSGHPNNNQVQSFSAVALISNL